MKNRRNFIKITAIGGAAAVLLPSAVFFTAKSVEDVGVDLIKNELHYLKLDEQGVRQYVRDYLQTEKLDFVSNLRWKSYYLLDFNSEESNNIKYFISYYLLATDFFINYMDESKLVRYLGVNHKYTSPCSSHFSFLLYPPKGDQT